MADTTYGLSPQEKLSLAQSRYRVLDNRRYGLWITDQFPDAGQTPAGNSESLKVLDKSLAGLQTEIDNLNAQINPPASTPSTSSKS